MYSTAPVTVSWSVWNSHTLRDFIKQVNSSSNEFLLSWELQSLWSDMSSLHPELLAHVPSNKESDPNNLCESWPGAEPQPLCPRGRTQGQNESSKTYFPWSLCPLHDPGWSAVRLPKKLNIINLRLILPQETPLRKSMILSHKEEWAGGLLLPNAISLSVTEINVKKGF